MSSTITKKLHKQKQKYIDFSHKKNKKQQDFVQKLQILNKKTGKISPLDYDFNKKQYDNYLWVVFNSIYLQNEMDKQNDKVAYFITQTLPTEYHPYHTHDRNGKKLQNFKYNKKYSKKNTISQGYQKLNTAFRSLIKDWKVNTDTYDRLYYNRVVEPHKSFVPHLHGLVYVDKEYAEDFEKYFWSKNKQHGLGRAELTRIKDIKRSATYLTKYISKSINPKLTNSNTNSNTLGNMYDGWKKTHKINVYTYSHIAIPRYIFNKVSNVLRLDIQNGENILEVVENLIDIHIDIYEKGKIINTKSITKCHSRYTVEIVKEKITQTEIHEVLRNEIRLYFLNRDTTKLQKVLQMTEKELWQTVIQFALDEGIIEKRLYYNNYTKEKEYEMLDEWLYTLEDRTNVVSYRLSGFKIYDKKYDKVIYDKEDYELYTK